MGLQDRDFMKGRARRRRHRAPFIRSHRRARWARRVALVVGTGMLALFGWVALRAWSGIADEPTDAVGPQDVARAEVVGVTDGDTFLSP